MMSQSQYSLTWEAHVKNVCDGLSSLQQNGEFVDMTLAADGHMVKVHQVVLALASPYFKELITSAQCPHPVIFLSKITHATLSAILEYIYTGEVLVSLEHLNDLVEAAKELHIKGLKDMKVHSSLAETSKPIEMPAPTEGEMLEDEDLCLFHVTHEEVDNLKEESQQPIGTMDNITQFEYENAQLDQEAISHEIQGEQLIDNVQDIPDNQLMDSTQELPDNQLLDPGPIVQDQDNIGQEIHNENEFEDIADEDMPDSDSNLAFDAGNSKMDATCSALQYTVSNQGSLQMILNRFVYYLKHTNRDKSRQWRCVDYLSQASKCPAHVFTKDDIVVHRIAAHTHPFHDKKILKKLRNGVVFSAFTEAEKEGHIKKNKPTDVNTTE